MSTLSHRLVPIRPSPQRGASCQKGISVIKSSPKSPIDITPPQTGTKRKYDDEDDDSDAESCKRRINFAMNYVCSPQPVSISRRNARERNRVKQVNNGFAALRQHIPGAAKAKKISKVDTLKQAVEYIQNLQMLLDENDRALDHSRQYIPHPNSSIPGSSQFTSNYSINTPPPLPSKDGFLMPPFFYNENISPNSNSSEPSLMSPELTPTSVGEFPHGLSSFSSPHNSISTSMDMSSSNVNTLDNIITSFVCSLTSGPQTINTNPSPIFLNISKSNLEKNSQFLYNNMHQSEANVTRASRSTEISIDTLNHKPVSSVSVKQHPAIGPTLLHQPVISPGGTTLCSSSKSASLLTRNSINVPVMSAQIYQGPSRFPSHQSLILRPPDQTPVAVPPPLQATTPADLGCLPIDNLQLLQANYSTYETQSDTIDESSYESSQESSFNTSINDSSFAANTTRKSPSPGITNIDSVLSSNLMSSFKNLVDVYESIEHSTSLGSDDDLDAIDLWEKC